VSAVSNYNEIDLRIHILVQALFIFADAGLELEPPNRASWLTCGPYDQLLVVGWSAGGRGAPSTRQRQPATNRLS
jgi:hypothetical protein